MEGVARGMKNNSQFFPPRGLNIKSGRLSKGVPVFVFLTPWVNGGGGGGGLGGRGNGRMKWKG